MIDADRDQQKNADLVKCLNGARGIDVGEHDVGPDRKYDELQEDRNTNHNGIEFSPVGVLGVNEDLNTLQPKDFQVHILHAVERIDKLDTFKCLIVNEWDV